jgi:hypothetical protein
MYAEKVHCDLDFAKHVSGDFEYFQGILNCNTQYRWAYCNSFSFGSVHTYSAQFILKCPHFQPLIFAYPVYM